MPETYLTPSRLAPLGLTGEGKAVARAGRGAKVMARPVSDGASSSLGSDVEIAGVGERIRPSLEPIGLKVRNRGHATKMCDANGAAAAVLESVAYLNLVFHGPR